ncbi:MAG: hypothetical protein ACI86M_000049 [Saprospiraceae bacterium]|jgi:hypothetical protein
MNYDKIIAAGVKKNALLEKKRFLKRLDQVEMHKRQVLNIELNELFDSVINDSEE